MPVKKDFILNRIIQPNVPLKDFIQFAAECSACGIEIRNDLPNPQLLDGIKPEEITALCKNLNMKIVTVNALQKFNVPSLFEEKKRELAVMLDKAVSVECSKIVLCPLNDISDSRSEEQKHKDLTDALNEYAPLFAKRNAIGLLEPLGFESSSMRFKKQAVKAIQSCNAPECYRILHDTFHHYLSGEQTMYPEFTELVHLSGVYAGKTKKDITDADRVMPDEKDIMNNKGQLSYMQNHGFAGYISFEPFSPQIQKLSGNTLKEKVFHSMEYLFD